MIKHSVEIPDWMWKKFQALSGTKIPATFIRNTLSEHLLSKGSEPVIEDEDEIFEDEIETSSGMDTKPVPKDTGTLFTVNRSQMCICKRTLTKGDDAVIFTATDEKKYVVHPTCWDALV